MAEHRIGVLSHRINVVAVREATVVAESGVPGHSHLPLTVTATRVIDVLITKVPAVVAIGPAGTFCVVRDRVVGSGAEDTVVVVLPVKGGVKLIHEEAAAVPKPLMNGRSPAVRVRHAGGQIVLDGLLVDRGKAGGNLGGVGATRQS